MTGWQRLKATISDFRTNDNGAVTPLGDRERAKMLLRNIRKLHLHKLKVLGISYQVLGDAAWLVLCDIYLHNLSGQDISIDDLEASQSLAPNNAARYVKVLEQEGLVARYPVDTHHAVHNLQLTKLGASKVRLLLDQHR